MARPNPRRDIESEEYSDEEHAYLKFPGKRLAKISDPDAHLNYRSVSLDFKKWQETYKTHHRDYGVVHTHPTDPNLPSKMRAIPSSNDLRLFLGDLRAKYMGIAQTNSETGEVMGYFVMRKTKQTPRALYTPSESKEDNRNRIIKNNAGLRGLLAMIKSVILSKRIVRDSEEYEKQGYKERYSPLKTLADKYDMRYKFIPAKGYTLDKSNGQFKRNESVPVPPLPEKKKVRTNLIQETLDGLLRSPVWIALTTIAALILMINFFPIRSAKVIQDINLIESSSINFQSIILFLLTLAAIVIFLKKKK